jgi:hypothetical protein
MVATVTGLSGGALCVIGTLFPWWRVSLRFGSLDYSIGVAGRHLWPGLMCAAVGLAVVVLGAYRLLSESKRSLRGVSAATLLLGLLAILLVLIGMMAGSPLLGADRVDLSPGVVVPLVGGASAIVGGALGFPRPGRPSSRPAPPAPGGFTA